MHAAARIRATALQHDHRRAADYEATCIQLWCDSLISVRACVSLLRGRVSSGGDFVALQLNSRLSTVVSRLETTRQLGRFKLDRHDELSTGNVCVYFVLRDVYTAPTDIV